MAVIHSQLAESIIKHQEGIIGPISWTQADKVSGLSVKDKNIAIKGDGKQVIEDLVNQYATIFGQASVEACKDAVRKLISANNSSDIPEVLLK